MTKNVQTGMAPVNGAELYYKLTGEGPTLVLAHAGVADSTMWDEQVDAFATHYRVLRYDMRGFGKSSSAPGTFSHHQDLSILLDILGIAQAHFLGLSNGGMVVTDFALEYPEKVLSLVLVSSAVSGFEFKGEPPQTIVQLMNALGAEDLDGATEIAAQIWADGPLRTPEQVSGFVRERLKTMSRTALRNQLPNAAQPQGLEPPAWGRLREVTVPTLVVLGDKDDPSILEIGETLEHDINGAEKVVIPGTAHMLNMERPEAFNQLVLDFLGRQRIGA